MESIFESLENLNVSEECFNSIISIVEEIINERNKENREAKRNWELSRGYKASPFFTNQDLKSTEKDIKSFRKYANKDDYLTQSTGNDLIDSAARSNRIALGREQNPVSYADSTEFSKQDDKESRKRNSQRGTDKDPYLYTSDKLAKKQADKLHAQEKNKQN